MSCLGVCYSSCLSTEGGGKGQGCVCNNVAVVVAVGVAVAAVVVVDVVAAAAQVLMSIEKVEDRLHWHRREDARREGVKD